jgi:hypothetical protein
MGRKPGHFAGDVGAQGLAHAGALDVAQCLGVAHHNCQAPRTSRRSPVRQRRARQPNPHSTKRFPLERWRLVLRMWAVDLQLINDRRSSVWVGSVLEERFDRPLSLFTLARTLRDVNTPRDAVSGAIQSGRIAVRSDRTGEHDWDGRVLLARESSLNGADEGRPTR